MRYLRFCIGHLQVQYIFQELTDILFDLLGIGFASYYANDKIISVTDVLQ